MNGRLTQIRPLTTRSFYSITRLPNGRPNSEGMTDEVGLSDWIALAADAECAASPAFAERIAAAQALLLRGGWYLDVDNALRWRECRATWETCTCQEGAVIICLHQVAAQLVRAAWRTARMPTDMPKPAPGDAVRAS